MAVKHIISPDELAREFNNPNSPFFKAKQFALQCIINTEQAIKAEIQRHKQQEQKAGSPIKKLIRGTRYLYAAIHAEKIYAAHTADTNKLEKTIQKNDAAIVGLQLRMHANNKNTAEAIFEKVNPGQTPSKQQLEALTISLNNLANDATHPIKKITETLKLVFTLVSKSNAQNDGKEENTISYESNLKPSEIKKAEEKIQSPMATFLKEYQEDAKELKDLIKLNTVLKMDYKEQTGQEYTETPEQLLATAAKTNDFSRIINPSPKPGANAAEDEDELEKRQSGLNMHRRPTSE